MLRAEFGGTALFDLASPPITYRVFLLPGALQVDLLLDHRDQAPTLAARVEHHLRALT
ncbi:hypothetical protein F4560_003646 [Saccharothrix ecbatanensis]|uniref:Uncharacterized protein n=1 Tax=Saccharothrix ecbatanensis TaxID=1105145 RepID=A0A7W9M1I0_9PSEU|nr:hypothetical protein [Saccharothrix ecbatanensis]MBB5803878.1 hypothetical protein [Saccharothrix ecbatanensis]